jgi:hypothetical protein
LRGRRVLQNAYVVHDLERAILHWNRIAGAGPFFANNAAQHSAFTYRGEPSEAILRTALTQLGEVQIELIEQTNMAPSVFREILDSRGEGIHHVRIECTCYSHELERLIRTGHPVAFEGDILGVVRFAFLDTCSTLGHFIEISETFGALSGRDERIARICGNWDGSALVRDIRDVASG